MFKGDLQNDSHQNFPSQLENCHHKYDIANKKPTEVEKEEQNIATPFGYLPGKRDHRDEDHSECGIFKRELQNDFDQYLSSQLGNCHPEYDFTNKEPSEVEKEGEQNIASPFGNLTDNRDLLDEVLSECGIFKGDLQTDFYQTWPSQLGNCHKYDFTNKEPTEVENNEEQNIASPFRNLPHKHDHRDEDLSECGTFKGDLQNDFHQNLPSPLADPPREYDRSNQTPSDNYKTIGELQIYLCHNEASNSEATLHKSDHCGKGFKGKDVYRTVHLEDRPSKRDDFGNTLKLKSGLRNYTNLLSENRSYHCYKCGKDFAIKRYLRNHMLIHSEDFPYKCDSCEKCFKWKNNLYRHTAVHKTDLPHKCDVCQKSYLTKHLLKEHIKSHSQDRPHKCGLCDLTFKAKTYLKNHMIVHSVDRPHHCDDCGKRFKRKFEFRQHVLKHSIKRHYCIYCKNMFTKEDDLNNHMKVHIVDYPHKCNECNKRFTTKLGLCHHMKIHSEDRSYKCNNCEAAYKEKDQLLRHMIIHSKISPEK